MFPLIGLSNNAIAGWLHIRCSPPCARICLLSFLLNCNNGITTICMLYQGVSRFQIILVVLWIIQQQST